MEDLVGSSVGELILSTVPADGACDRGMGSTSQSSLPEIRIRLGNEGGLGSTLDGGGLLELNATNLLALVSQEVIEVAAAGEEAVGEESYSAEVEFLETVGGVSRSPFVPFLLAPAALPKSTSNKARSVPSSTRSGVAMVTLP